MHDNRDSPLESEGTQYGEDTVHVAPVIRILLSSGFQLLTSKLLDYFFRAILSSVQEVFILQQIVSPHRTSPPNFDRRSL
jgi:hypothetical protein